MERAYSSQVSNKNMQKGNYAVQPQIWEVIKDDKHESYKGNSQPNTYWLYHLLSGDKGSGIGELGTQLSGRALV